MMNDCTIDKIRLISIRIDDLLQHATSDKHKYEMKGVLFKSTSKEHLEINHHITLAYLSKYSQTDQEYIYHKKPSSKLQSAISKVR
jgi:hypothetical protein